MSTESPAATTYARALLEASGADAAAVADELDSLVASIAEHADTWHTLIAPELASTTRRAAVDGISSDAKPCTRNLAPAHHSSTTRQKRDKSTKATPQ